MAHRYRPHPDLAWRLVDGVVFLLTPDSRYHQIDDPVGVAVWQALSGAPADGAPDRDGLAARVAERFDVSRETAAADLAPFLDELERVGAVERVEPAEGPAGPGR